MSNNNNKDVTFLAELIEHYYVLPYTHEELLDILERIKYGHILSKSEYEAFKDIILGGEIEGEILFSGDYNDLINKPKIPEYFSELKDYNTVMNRINLSLNSLTKKDIELDEKVAANSRYLSALEVILDKDIKRLQSMIDACRLFEGESLNDVINNIMMELGWLDYIRKDISEGKVLSEKNFTAVYEEILKSIDETADGLSGYIKRVIAESIVDPGQPNGNGTFRLDSIGEALATKVDKKLGYGLSKYDFSDKYKEILDAVLGDNGEGCGTLTEYIVNVVDRYEQEFQYMISDLGERMTEYTENQIQEMKLYMYEKMTEIENVMEETKKDTLGGVSFQEGDGPTSIALGGLEKGTYLEGKTVREVLLNILCPFVAPSVSGSLDLYAGSDYMTRIGNVVSIKRICAHIEKGSYPIVRTTFYHKVGNKNIELKTYVGHQAEHEFYAATDYEITSSIDSDYFMVEVEDTAGNVASSGTQPIDIVYPIYYGVAKESEEINAALLENMPELLRNNGESCTISYTTKEQRMIFAVPQGYGNLIDIFDQNNYIITNSFQYKTVTLKFNIKEKASDGSVKVNEYKKIYHVYYNNPSTVNTFDITYKF